MAQTVSSRFLFAALLCAAALTVPLIALPGRQSVGGRVVGRVLERDSGLALAAELGLVIRDRRGITRTHRRADLIRRVQALHFERLFGRPATGEELDVIGLLRSHVGDDAIEHIALIGKTPVPQPVVVACRPFQIPVSRIEAGNRA